MQAAPVQDEATPVQSKTTPVSSNVQESMMDADESFDYVDAETDHTYANAGQVDHNVERNHINENVKSQNSVKENNTKKKTHTGENLSSEDLAIIPAPKNVPNQKSDTSDGEGTISDAYERNCATENVTVQVHHSIDSQHIQEALESPLLYTEETETASEIEDQQQHIIEVDNPGININDQVFTIIGGNKRNRVKNSSSDEEVNVESGNIISKVGSFVNSYLPIISEKDKEKRRKKDPDPS